MTTVLLFLSCFITKLPPDTTALRTFPARNNCSPGFPEYLGVCFSATNFSLLTFRRATGEEHVRAISVPLSSLFYSLELMWWDAIKSPEECKVERSMSPLHSLGCQHSLRRRFLSQSSHPGSHMCLLPWAWLTLFVTPFIPLASQTSCDDKFLNLSMHCAERDFLLFVLNPLAGYFHWVSQAVRSQWTVIPWLSSLHHSYIF